MSTAPGREFCPYCAATIPASAGQCPRCGAWLGAGAPDQRLEAGAPGPREWGGVAEGYEPRPRRKVSKDVEATDFLIPTNVSGWALASCYMGLIGFCLPIIGLLFAIPAFICGIVAVQRPAQQVSYGSVTSNIRAIIGLVLSGLAILIWGGFLLFLLMSKARNFR